MQNVTKCSELEFHSPSFFLNSAILSYLTVHISLSLIYANKSLFTNINSFFFYVKLMKFPQISSIHQNNF